MLYDTFRRDKGEAVSKSLVAFTNLELPIKKKSSSCGTLLSFYCGSRPSCQLEPISIFRSDQYAQKLCYCDSFPALTSYLLFSILLLTCSETDLDKTTTRNNNMPSSTHPSVSLRSLSLSLLYLSSILVLAAPSSSSSATPGKSLPTLVRNSKYSHLVLDDAILSLVGSGGEKEDVKGKGKGKGKGLNEASTDKDESERKRLDL